jgi:alcohol dehydrogenase (cytochrome c)
MYLPGPNGGVQALDGVTGETLWTYKKDIESQDPPQPPNYTWDDFSWMRNIAIYADRIYMATHDAHIMALDARNGKVLWDTKVADYKVGYRYTSGPIVVKGKIVTGMTGCERFKNDTCFITAHDAATGQELWRTSTVARPGEPGGDTWGDLPLMFRSGSDAWIPGSYDPKTNLIYYSTAQAKPWARVSRRTDGDALYTNSVLALDPDTGKIVWFHQLIPGETHDEDEVFENILIDHSGRSSLFKMGKLGILWELDRRTGKFIDAHDLGYQNVGYVDKTKGQLRYETGKIPELDKPLEWCGNVRNWPAMAYHPETQALYVPASGLSCGTSVYSLMEMVEGGGGRWYGEKTLSRRPNPLNPFPGGGQFLAMDIKSGRVLWRHETKRSSASAALTTGGGLAIIGDGDRYLYVDDATTGKTLFQTRLLAPARGFPISYAVGGRQYLAVPTAGEQNAVFVFGVPQGGR